jgi:hypothetical protein
MKPGELITIAIFTIILVSYIIYQHGHVIK